MKKTNYLKLFFFGWMIFFTSYQAKATHFEGGELVYTCLGSNQYKFTLSLYAACPANFSINAATIHFTSANCTDFSAQLSPAVNSPVITTNYCPSLPSLCNSNIGSKKYIYSGIVTVPNTCSDWEVYHENAPRAVTYSNIYNGFGGSSNDWMYIRARLDPTLSNCNSSPVFIEDHPVQQVCQHDTVSLSFTAIDLDGDSLVYSLVDVLTSNGNSVIYSGGYSGSSPISGVSSLNSASGILTLIPTLQQSCIIDVQVDEYRNGIKIGEVRRDMVIHIVSCSNDVPKIETLNGVSVDSTTISLSVVPNTLYSTSMTFADAEVDSGFQTLKLDWQYLPNGAMIDTADNLFWTPTFSQIGTHFLPIRLEDDHCSITGVTAYVLKIEVLGGINYPPTAVDDYYSTTANLQLSNNLLTNDFDINGDSIYIDTIPIQSPFGGNISIQSNGDFTYQANPNFVGTDFIIYQICDNGSPSLCSQGTLFISVDTVSQISAAMPVGTVGNICLNTVSLSNISSINLVSDSLNNASILFIDVNTGCIVLDADSIAQDTLTFLVCDNAGSCIQSVLVLDVRLGVWPGDADANQAVNHFDLLPIGIGYGKNGTSRPNPSIVWNGYLASDWNYTTPNSLVNYKHIDCNGDGTINVQDTLAISNNWGNSYTFNKNGAGNIPLFIDTLQPTSSKAILPIILGVPNIPANDIYGLAFTILYDTALVKPNTTFIRTDTSWLGTAGIDLISIQKDFYNDGMIQVAMTRTDSFNTSGFGRIGSLNFTIQDDIMQRGQLIFPFDIIDVQAIDNGEQLILVNPIQTDLTITTSTNTVTNYLFNTINVFPNPTSDILNIQSKNTIIEKIILTDMTGKVIHTQMIHQKQIELYMQNIPKGIYTLSILTEQGQVQKKISVLR